MHCKRMTANRGPSWPTFLTFLTCLGNVPHCSTFPTFLWDWSHLFEYFYRLFTIEINSAIANNLKPLGMMKMQCVTIYPNIYECVSD